MKERFARLAPTEIAVCQLRYRNPFAETMTAIGTGTEALTKGAGAIETLATLGLRRRIKAEAQVAMATVDYQVENSKLDLELKREKLRQTKSTGETNRECSSLASTKRAAKSKCDERAPAIGRQAR